MTPEEKDEALLAILGWTRHMHIIEIADAAGMSKETARMALLRLEQGGRVKRTGGFNNRVLFHQIEKALDPMRMKWV